VEDGGRWPGAYAGSVAAFFHWKWRRRLSDHSHDLPIQPENNRYNRQQQSDCPRRGKRTAAYFAKIDFGSSAWTPLVTSTIWVTWRSMAALSSMRASSRGTPLVSTIKLSVSRVAIFAVRG
jgi:hypothetical protein